MSPKDASWPTAQPCGCRADHAVFGGGDEEEEKPQPKSGATRRQQGNSVSGILGHSAHLHALVGERIADCAVEWILVV